MTTLFADGTWTYLVEYYTRYAVDFIVEPNAMNANLARVLPAYRRVVPPEQPSNVQLERCLNICVAEVETILAVRHGYENPDDFVCRLFCLCVALVTSNVGAEALISRGLHDELQLIRFALDLAFEHPIMRQRLSSVHLKMIVAGLLILQCGLAISRPVHRSVIPVKSLLVQLQGRSEDLARIPCAALFRTVAQEVDTTPSVPELVEPLLQFVVEQQAPPPPSPPSNSNDAPEGDASVKT